MAPLIFCLSFHPLSQANRRAVCSRIATPYEEASFIELHHVPVNERLPSFLYRTLSEAFGQHPLGVEAPTICVVADEGEQALAALTQESLYRFTGRFPQVLDLVVIHDEEGEFVRYTLGQFYQQTQSGSLVSSIRRSSSKIVESLAREMALLHGHDDSQVRDDHVTAALEEALMADGQEALPIAALYVFWVQRCGNSDTEPYPFYMQVLAALREQGFILKTPTLPDVSFVRSSERTGRTTTQESHISPSDHVDDLKKAPSSGHNIILVDQQFRIRGEKKQAALAAVKQSIYGGISLPWRDRDGQAHQIPFRFQHEQRMLASRTLEGLLIACGFLPRHTRRAGHLGDIVGLGLDIETEYREEAVLFRLIGPFVDPGFLEFKSDEESGFEHWRDTFSGEEWVRVTPRLLWSSHRTET